MYVEQSLSGVGDVDGWWRRLRKIRPSKWKPKDFAKAAGVIGAGVILGPAAAGLAVKAGGAAAGLAARAGAGRIPTSSLLRVAQAQLTPKAETFAPVQEPSLPAIQEAQGATGGGSQTGLLIAAGLGLFLLSRRR